MSVPVSLVVVFPSPVRLRVVLDEPLGVKLLAMSKFWLDRIAGAASGGH